MSIEQRVTHLNLSAADFMAVTGRELEQLIGHSKQFFREGFSEAKHSFSIENMDNKQIAAKLGSLPVGERFVFACWPAFHEAYRVSWQVFLDYFDEFWRPSSDDVLVVPDDKRWHLVITHEEIVCFK